MLSKTLNRSLNRRRNDDGFTLIELLVVVVILGILIGIAIPVYLNYRKSANDKAAQSDLRNSISTLESCAADNSTYPTGPASLTPGTAMTGCSGQTLSLSSQVTLYYVPDSGAANYIAFTAASGGTSGKYYCYASAAGGSVKQVSSKVTAYQAACPTS